MKKLLFVLILIGTVQTFTSCVSVKSVSFECLQQAEVNYPSQVKTVGVVNCTPVMSKADWNKFEIPGFCEGNGKTTAEILAQEIAETHYFEQVIISDSTLVPLNTDIGLSNGQIDSLIRSLDVDMLFTVERIKLQIEKGSVWSSQYMRNLPAIHVAIAPLIGAYKEGREAPLFKLLKADTLSFEWTRDLPLQEIIEVASEHVATSSMKHLLPHWEEVERYYFDGGNSEMRDAGVYVREQNWVEAAELWKTLYEKKKGKNKMYAAFNLALYHEMQSEFDIAKDYLEVASRLAADGSPEKSLIMFYLFQLEEHSKRNQKLQIQMKRFEE